MSDKLVFDLAQEVEGSPNVFIRKDWLNILDNQNQNYNNNQSVVDTSQLSNSNKYMSYREAYFSMPFLLTLGTTGTTFTGVSNTIGAWTPNSATAVLSSDYAVGLKNWFGQIIHSFTLDYNGTTIIQQTPYIQMWNSFKLMTSLSLDDVNTQGATIGFFPDDADTWQWAPSASATGVATTSIFSYGQGICNNSNYDSPVLPLGTLANGTQFFNSFSSGQGNRGFLRRQQLINFDLNALPSVGNDATASVTACSYGSFLSGAGSQMNLLWKSFISKKQDQVITAGVQSTAGLLQYSIVGTIYLKHIHAFFNMCPLLKGVFMKMTMNLNNTTTVLESSNFWAGNGTPSAGQAEIICKSVSCPLGGVNPVMVASAAPSNGGLALVPAGTNASGTPGTIAISYRLNYSVGATCLDSTLASLNGVQPGALSKSVYLYIPSYTFNPIFEQAYLSSPVKQIKYTDVYQYQVLGVSSGATFNNLLTNGIANIKSVLILPYFSSQSAYPIVTPITGVPASSNSGFVSGLSVFQSPFDVAGTGPTSPLTYLTNFNVQISGQNAIYNTQKYNFEQFNNQLYGQNGVNGGLTDGLCSGLIDRQKFDMSYSYYYVNVERMLPVEMSVPKSVQILGQNLSSKYIDLYCFIEYGLDISIDALTGARV